MHATIPNGMLQRPAALKETIRKITKKGAGNRKINARQVS
jgi:hypothetical protein